MFKGKIALAPAQLLFCMLATIGLSVAAILGSKPQEQKMGTAGVWALAQSGALEIFMAAGGRDTMESRIRELWGASFSEEMRRRVILTDSLREGRDVVGSIRVVEFVGGNSFLGYLEGEPVESTRRYYSEEGVLTDFSQAVLEATDGYTLYVLWKPDAPKPIP